MFNLNNKVVNINHHSNTMVTPRHSVKYSAVIINLANNADKISQGGSIVVGIKKLIKNIVKAIRFVFVIDKTGYFG